MTRTLSWSENDTTFERQWISESSFSPPKKIMVADDRLKADEFYRQASEGAAFVYKGDFQNAKQLLQAVQRRIEKRKKPTPDFHRHRQAQAHKAQILSRLLISVEDDHSIHLRRSPSVVEAISEAVDVRGAFVVSLRELLGYIGAHEWRKKGVFIPSLGDVIFPHYGLFSPIRGEYLDLVTKATLSPKVKTAFDIGTGTGVIAAILAKRGVEKIIATDLNPRAIECAKTNIDRLGFSSRVKLELVDMFPAGKADLIVCNPPWLPARPTSTLESAVYDENNQMLLSFLKGVKSRLSKDGEAWLIISDLAERLNLRNKDAIASWISENGLTVMERLETKPKHGKALDENDPLHYARSQEITSLWRLK